MKKNEYLKLAVKNKLPLKLNWLLSMFSLTSSDTNFIKREDDHVLVFINDEWIVLTDVNKNDIVFSFKDKIIINTNDIVNIKDETEVTIAEFIVNFILLVTPFNDKIPFISGKIKISNIENIVLPLLRKDDTTEEGIFKVSEYRKFGNCVTFIRGWVPFTVISTTKKSMSPPSGILEYRKKLIKEYKDNYGKDVFKDFNKLAEFEDDLKAFDLEFLKDDPTLGVMSSGKILNIARKKLFLTVGSEQGFSEKPEAQTVESSLLEGWPDNKEDFAKMSNSFRAGSFAGGQETQEGGVVAKTLARATMNLKVDVKDCNVKYGIKLHINNDNKKQLIGRYVIINGVTSHLKDFKAVTSYVGKDMEFRSPMFCKAKGDSLCKKCMGDVASRLPNSITLMSTTLGGKFLNLALKKRHGTTLSLYEYTLDDLIH